MQRDPRRLLGPWCWCVLAAAVVGAIVPRAGAAEYLVDTDTLEIRRDGALYDFGGSLVSAYVLNGKATFNIGGDVVLGSGDTLRGVGSRAASFRIGNNLSISPGASIDFSAIGTTPGAGGGVGGGGGLGGLGGFGGDGGKGGGVQWVRGGGAMIFFIPGAVPPPVPGLWGRDGEAGDDGDAGFTGSNGLQGRRGFGNTASLADGGAGGFDGSRKGFAGSGGWGGDMAAYWPSPLPSLLPGVPTKDGGDGYSGFDGFGGQSGADGASGSGGQFGADPASFDLVAGNGGGGGGGAQGGAGGGGAGGGGGGAAGQGNWAKSFGFAGFNIASVGGSGGPGSAGGDGGQGGAGGDGGQGGAGAGAAEFFVQGQIDLDGQANARGGSGQAGTSGVAGTAGSANAPLNQLANDIAVLPIPGVTTVPFLPPPPVPIPDPFLAGFGGYGAVGGDGGAGGLGGVGGGGGGGSGGTLKFVGSNLTGGGSISVAGGLGTLGGETFDDGQAGQLLVGTNTAAAGSSAISAFGGGVGLTGNDTLSRIGTLAPNPFVAGQPSVPTIVGLSGGAEAFGMTGLNPLDILIANPGMVEPAPTLVTGADQEANAFAGLALFDIGPGDFTPADLGFNEDYVGYDMLLMFTAKGSAVDNPMLGVGQEDYLLPLLTGGWANDPLFGGVADTALGGMAGFSVYATLIPEGSEWFNFSVESGGLILSEKVQALNFGEPVYLTSSPDVPVLDAAWNAGNGNWSNAANWDLTFADTGLPPDGTETPMVPAVPSNVASYAYNIFIQNAAAVDADIVVTVDQLNIGVGDSLTIMDNKSLTVERFAVRTDSGRIVNDGLIQLTGAGVVPTPGDSAILYISGQGLMLEGAGTLATSVSSNNIIAGLRDTDSLVQGAGHTINASGLLGNNALVMTNHGRITTNGGLMIDPTGDAQRNTAAFINTGTVDLDGSAEEIYLTDGFFRNEPTGLIEATNGATLIVNDARIHNDGTIHIDDTSSIVFSGMSMLAGNDLQVDPYFTQIDIVGTLANPATLVNQTNLTGLVSIQNATVYNDADVQIGGYVGTEGDWSETDIYNASIIGGKLDGYLFATDTNFHDVTFMPDAQLEAFAGIGLSGVIDNQAGVGQGGNGAAQGYLLFGSFDEITILDDAVLQGEGLYEGIFSFGGPGGGGAVPTLTIAPETTVSPEFGFNGGMRVENHGEINDDYANDGLFIQVDEGWRNAGLIRAGFTDLYLESGSVDNTDGVIETVFGYLTDVTIANGVFRGDPTLGGNVGFDGVRLESFHSPGGGGFQYFELDVADVQFTNVTFTAQTDFVGYDGQNSFVTFNEGVKIEGNGGLYLSGVSLDFATDFGFDSDGTLTLDSVFVGGSGSTITIGEDFTVASDFTGFDVPEFGLDSLRIVNHGTINGTDLVVDPLGLASDPQPGLVNRGLITGSAYLEDAHVDNEGGVIDGPSIAGANIRGGVVRNAYVASYFVGQFFGPNADAFATRLEDVTLEGSVDVEDDVQLTLAGDIVNNAYLTLADNVLLVIDGSVRLSGAGFLDMGMVQFLGSSEDDTLTNEEGHTIYTFGSVLAAADAPQLINHGELYFGQLAEFQASFRTETLPAGTEVPDVSDPNDPDATMILGEETTYQIIRPIVNTGLMQFYEAGVFDGTVLDNTGGQILGTVQLQGSTLLNVDGTIDSTQFDMIGNSVLTGGQVAGFISIFAGTDPAERAALSEIVVDSAEVLVAGPVELGGNVDMPGSLVTVDMSAIHGPDAVFIQSDESDVQVDDLTMLRGAINLSAGALTVQSLFFSSEPAGYPILNWTGGSFELVNSPVRVGTTAMYGTPFGAVFAVPANGRLTAPLGVEVASGGTFQVGGLLVSPTIVNDGIVDVGYGDADGSLATPISGAGMVRKIGLGTFALAALNSYLGDTEILGGTLEAETSESLGGPAGVIHLLGGNLRITGPDTGATPRALVFNSIAATIDVADPNAIFEVSSASVNALPFALTKSGPGTLNYGATLAMGPGQLTVNDGRLDLLGHGINLDGTDAPPGSTGDAAGDVDAAGELAASWLLARGGDGGAGANGTSTISASPANDGQPGATGGPGGVLTITAGQVHVASTIDLTGGRGGRGGDGANATFSANDGDGGDGGRGGNGGGIFLHGGELVFTSGSIDLGGGDGGQGGFGADSGEPNGQPGQPGFDGTLRLLGGTLTTNRSRLDLNLTGNFQFSSGVVRLTDAVFDVDDSARLNAALGTSSKVLFGGRGLQVDNTLQILGGQSLTIASGGSLAAGTIDGTLGGTFSFLGGTLSVGQFLGDLEQQGGTLAPGASPGTTAITGDYTAQNGSIAIELAGTDPGLTHDWIDVAGDLTLANMTLDVTLLAGFTLAAGQVFDILTIGGVRTGEFAGLPENGSAGTFGAFALRATYAAGDGNDVALITVAAGDANGDGLVNVVDLGILATNWQSNGTMLDGDFSGDGFVDASDLGILAGAWPGGAGALQTALAGTPLAVPEPTAVVMLGLAGLGLIGRRRRCGAVSAGRS